MTTNLEVSKMIKEMGVELPSHSLYVLDKSTKTYHLWCSDFYACGGLSPDVKWAKGYENSYKAYTLDELPAVLKTIGEKKGWNNQVCNNSGASFRICECGYNELGGCNGDIIELWKFHFLHICSLHADSIDWNEYLKSIIE